MKRTDIHRPSEFRPEDYRFLGMIYTGPLATLPCGAPEFNDPDLLRTARANAVPHHRSGNCDHCGAAFQYGAVFQHAAGECVVVGHVCAAERFPLSNIDFAHKRMVEKVAAAREHGKRLAVRAAFLSDKPELEAALAAPHHIIGDIDRKLTQYGSISEKQIALVLRLATEARDREAQAAARAALLATAPPLPEGRYVIEGTVVSTKAVESHFGYRTTYTTKCLIALPDGNKVWGTVPSSIDPCEVKGARVRITATVARSNDDPHFGFYSRPAKGEVLTPA